jgi:hypothetical protein
MIVLRSFASLRMTAVWCQEMGLWLGVGHVGLDELFGGEPEVGDVGGAEAEDVFEGFADF